MSDEQTPPAPLRLKPRLKTAEGDSASATPAAAAPPAPPVEPPPSPPPAAPAELEPKMRLKPRLAVVSPEAAAAPTQVSPAPAAETPSATSAPPEPPGAVAAAPAAETPPAAPTPFKVQLKPRITLAPPAAATTAAPAPESSAPPAPAAAPAADAPPAAPVGEAGKFKFKPKVPGPPPPAVGAAPPPPPPPPSAAGGPPKFPPPPGAKSGTNPPMPPPPPGMPKPPPFPVVAPPKTGKSTPPMPLAGSVTEPPMSLPEGAVKAKAPAWKNKKILIGAAAAVVALLGAGAWFMLRPAPVPPLPPQATKAAVAPPVAKTAAPGGPALSATQAAIAHAPVNAINKAKDVAAKRVGGDQGRDAISAITDDDTPAGKSAAKAPAAPVMTSSKIAPGISATNDAVTAAAEASPAFRSFVANARISGVIQASPQKPAAIMLNSRLARAGDVVESSLGITFDSVDADKKLILFKDKLGAVVSRRY